LGYRVTIHSPQRTCQTSNSRPPWAVASLLTDRTRTCLLWSRRSRKELKD